MAKDLMGELGLDTSDFEKALDRVGDKVGGKFANAMNSAAASFAKAFGAAAIGRYLYSLRNLGTDIDDLRSKMIAGSEDARTFDKSLEGSGAAVGFFRRLGNGWDQYRVKAKLAIGESIVGLKMAGEDFGNWLSKKMGYGGDVHEQSGQAGSDAKEDAQILSLKTQILRKEDEIADAQSKEVGTAEQGLDIARREAELANLRSRLANLQGATERQAANEAKVAQGAAAAAIRDRELVIQKSLIAAKGQTREIVLQQAGLSGAAKEARIYADFQQKIAQAIRDGRADLAGQLQIQQKLALQANAVAEHNMSPAQRREERRNARKYARDVRKTAAHEADLEGRSRRADSQGDRVTPGSELDRYRSRRKGAAQAGRDAGSAVLDSAAAAKFYTQGLADLDAIKTAMSGINKNR